VWASKEDILGQQPESVHSGPPRCDRLVIGWFSKILCWCILANVPIMQVTGLSNSEEELAGRSALVPFLLEDKIREVHGIPLTSFSESVRDLQPN
jgi:hypothetical protein